MSFRVIHSILLCDQVVCCETMSSVHLSRSILAITLLCTFLQFSDCQTTPFDPYSAVSVPNQTPTIPNEAEKTYTTTVNLEKINPTIQFVDSTFSNAAAIFYAAALQGFIQVDNVRSSDLTGNVIQVTYDVRYAYPILQGFVNGDDNEIKSKIGNIEAVRKGLNEQANILSYYTVLGESTAFSFGGSSICALASCNGTYVSCIETTDGIEATCVSDCKDGYCGDDGLCSHTNANVVPTCRCTSLPDLWILGQRCETKFPLWLFVLLAVIGFLIILLAVIIAVICVIKKRRKIRRKQELLNSVPKTYQNNGFVKDEIGNTQSVPQKTIVPTVTNPATSLARDDSFETVTSSEAPPSGYRPRSTPDRRSYASSAQPSTHDRRHHHHHDHRHHTHHRDSRGSPRPRRREGGNERARSTERDRHQRRSRTPSQHSSESDIPQKDDKNLSYYEIEVNDLDLETEAASSIVASSSTKSSPIRWLPPRNEPVRPGWVPSLGPLMYDLPGSKKTNTEYADIPSRRGGGTDV